MPNSTFWDWRSCNSILRRIVAFCGVLQRIAANCIAAFCGVLRRFAAFCSELRRFAAFCGVLRLIAANCGVLRRFAAFCGVLRRFAAEISSWGKCKLMEIFRNWKNCQIPFD